MATKKKSKRKQMKAKKRAGKKATVKKAVASKLAKKPVKKTVRKPVKKKAKKTAAPKKAAASKSALRAKPVSKAAAAPTKAKKRVRGKSESVDTVAFEPVGLGARSGGQSGDLQGITNRDEVDSESVDELLEEGNAFEAEVVQGVEEAGDEPEHEVRTREVPEDDVPGEYLEKD